MPAPRPAAPGTRILAPHSALIGLVALLACAWPLTASELELHYSGMERLLGQQVFTDQGRVYLQGSSTAECAYLFAEKPRVGRSADVIFVQVKLSGRAAVKVLGRCVGPGEAFDAWVTGVPRYADGVVYIDELRLETEKPRFTQVIRRFFEDTIAQQLRFPLRAEAMRGLEEIARASGNRVRLEELAVDSIVVGERALEISFDLRLVVE